LIGTNIYFINVHVHYLKMYCNYLICENLGVPGGKLVSRYSE